MSAEIDVPFTNPDAFTGGGDFLTPSDVFNPDTGLQKVLQATGASRAQSVQVTDALDTFGNNVKNFFGDLLGPNKTTSSNAGSPETNTPTQESTPSDAGPSTTQGPTNNGVSSQAKATSGQSGYSFSDFIGSTPGKIATGAGAVAGGSALVGLGLQSLTGSATKSLQTAITGAEQAIGLPPGGLSGLAVVGIGLLVLVLIVVAIAK